MMKSSFTRGRVIGLAVLAVLIVAMIFSTKFMTPAELEAALPKPFNPEKSASELYERAKTEIPAKAAPLGEVLTAIQADPKAAAEKYKAVSPTADSFVFAVRTTAAVTEGSDANLRLDVADAPKDTTVIVPLSTAVNGSVLRDAMGFKFADAPGQTDYQYVSDEVKKLIQNEVKSSVSDPASLKGKKVEVVGVIDVPLSNGDPPPATKPVNVQPMTIKEAP